MDWIIIIRKFKIISFLLKKHAHNLNNYHLTLKKKAE